MIFEVNALLDIEMPQPKLNMDIKLASEEYW